MDDTNNSPTPISDDKPKKKLDLGRLLFVSWFIILIVLIGVFNTPTTNKETRVLDDKYWQPQEQCAEWLPVYELEEDVYNCRLEPCERLKTDSGTLVDKCTCATNNKTVYRYCGTMLVFQKYIGGVNATNLLSING